MLRYDKLTVKAQEAMQAAQDIAEKNDQQQIEPLHLLAALVAQRDGMVPRCSSRLGVRPETLSGEIDKPIGAPAQGDRRVAAASQRRRQQGAGKRFRRSREIQGRVRFGRAYSVGHRVARI